VGRAGANSSPRGVSPKSKQAGGATAAIRDVSPRDTLASPSKGLSSRRPKYSPNVNSHSAAAAPGVRGPQRASSAADLASKRCEMADQLQKRCDGLYEDAVDRMHRLQEKRRTAERTKTEEAGNLQKEASARMRDYRRQYRFNDSRSHIEREEDHLRRKEQNLLKLKEDVERTLDLSNQDDSRVVACTGGARSSSTGATSSGANRPKSHTVADTTKLRKLVEKQFEISRKMADLEADVRKQKLQMTARWAELEARISKEEEDDMRFLAMEQSVIGYRTQAISDSSLPKDLRDEVQRKVSEILRPEQKAKELSLYQRKLEIIHELERLDLQVLKLSMAERKSITNMGYKLQLSEGWRQVMITEISPIVDEDLDSQKLPSMVCHQDSEVVPSIDMGEVLDTDGLGGSSAVLIMPDANQAAMSPLNSPVCWTRHTYESLTLPKSEASTAPDLNIDGDAGVDLASPASE